MAVKCVIVKKGVHIHISISPSSGDMGRQSKFSHEMVNDQGGD
jgi:hypothetical protein